MIRKVTTGSQMPHTDQCGSSLSPVFFTPYAAIIGLASHSTISSESRIPISTIDTTGFYIHYFLYRHCFVLGHSSMAKEIDIAFVLLAALYIFAIGAVRYYWDCWF